jgi:hypothetical protein
VLTHHDNNNDNDDNVKNVCVPTQHFNGNDDYTANKALQTQLAPTLHCSIWKGNKYYTTCGCIRSLRYPACNAHTPYCHLWTASSTILFHNFSKKARFSKQVTEHKMCI